MLEMEELKKEVACAQLAANKARKLEDTCHQGSEDRRGKSLDGWELETNVKQLRAQVYCFLLKVFVSDCNAIVTALCFKSRQQRRFVVFYYHNQHLQNQRPYIAAVVLLPLIITLYMIANGILDFVDRSKIWSWRSFTCKKS